MPGMPWSDREIEILEKHMKKDVERFGLQWINEVVVDLASQGYNRTFKAIHQRIKTLYGYRTHPSNHYLKHCVILRKLIEQDPPMFSGKRGEKERYAQEKAALAQAKLIEEGIDMPLHKLAISARTMITGNKIEKRKKSKWIYKGQISNPISPNRQYTQDHIDTAHWMYARYAAMYPREKREKIIELVSNDMNFPVERMEEILSHPPRMVAGE